MKLPRWIVIGMLTSSVLAVLAAAGWWWVTWPERTAREFVDLLPSADPSTINAMFVTRMGAFQFFLAVMSLTSIVVASRLLVRSATVAGELVVEKWPYLKANLRSRLTALARIRNLRQFTLRQLLIMVFILSGVFAYFGPTMRQRAAYYAGVRQGETDADAEWKNGNPSVYEGGMLILPTGPDPVTGLPFKHVGSGRSLSDQDAGRIEGHNDRIRQLLAASGHSRNW